MGTETRPHLLVDWGEEVVRARWREAALAAGVLHLALLVVILISPSFSGRALSPAEAEELARRQLTLLYLPSDLLKLPEPTPQPELTPEERQRMAVRTPLTLDPRELQLALPPPPPASPAASSPPSSAGGENQASLANRPAGGQPGQPQPSRGQGDAVRLEDLPRPSRGASSAPGLPMTSPGRTLEESMRQGPGQGAPGVPGGEVGSIQPNLTTPFPLILSDTRGVDFGPYLIRLVREVRRNWYAVIPESARWGEQGKVVIIFTIEKDGSVRQGQPVVVQSSGRSHLDRPAVASIRASQPFPPLPAEFTGPHIVLQFTFLYNLPLDYTGP